jgi:hypothetical protein
MHTAHTNTQVHTNLHTFFFAGCLEIEAASILEHLSALRPGDTLQQLRQHWVDVQCLTLSHLDSEVRTRVFARYKVRFALGNIRTLANAMCEESAAGMEDIVAHANRLMYTTEHLFGSLHHEGEREVHRNDSRESKFSDRPSASVSHAGSLRDQSHQGCGSARHGARSALDHAASLERPMSPRLPYDDGIGKGAVRVDSAVASGAYATAGVGLLRCLGFLCECAGGARYASRGGVAACVLGWCLSDADQEHVLQAFR